MVKHSVIVDDFGTGQIWDDVERDVNGLALLVGMRLRGDVSQLAVSVDMHQPRAGVDENGMYWSGRETVLRGDFPEHGIGPVWDELPWVVDPVVSKGAPVSEEYGQFIHTTSAPGMPEIVDILSRSRQRLELRIRGDGFIHEQRFCAPEVPGRD